MLSSRSRFFAGESMHGSVAVQQEVQIWLDWVV